MFGFILKKSFCDGWDNLLTLVLSNLVFVFTGFGLFLLTGLCARAEMQWPFLLMTIVSVMVLSVLLFAYSDTAAHIANFDGIHIVDFFKAIPGALKDGALFGFMNAAVFMISTFSIRYYLFETGTLIGFGLGCAIFWIDFFYLLAMQWFIPIRALMKNDFKKCFKKSFILLFDNTGFTLLMFLYNLIQLALSVVCIGFFPSIAVMLIGNTNALRVLLYKYDYLEEHPELKTRKERRQIPWDELLSEDREILGPRKLRSFLFPCSSKPFNPILFIRSSARRSSAAFRSFTVLKDAAKSTSSCE